jgi:hypothetical protein
MLVATKYKDNTFNPTPSITGNSNRVNYNLQFRKEVYQISKEFPTKLTILTEEDKWVQIIYEHSMANIPNRKIPQIPVSLHPICT